MTTRDRKVRTLRPVEESAFSGHLVGEIRAVDEDGRAHVVFPGSHDAPVAARSTVDWPWRAGEHPEDAIGQPVLLVFEEADPKRPIVVGLIRDALRPAPVRPELRLDADGERDVLVDGGRLVFDARQEVVLRCGKSTIVLQRDGRVLIRGTHLVSRSSGPNRIKGAEINLN